MIYAFSNRFNASHKLCGAAALLSILALASIASPLTAQELATDQLQAGRCMANANSAMQGVNAQESAILVPVSDVDAMAVKGFALVPCEQVFQSGDAQRAWRDLICTMTATQNQTVQDQMEIALGERPAALCGMAEQVVGPWDRMGGATDIPLADQ